MLPSRCHGDASKDLEAGTVLKRELIAVLRPAPLDSIFPYDIDRILGMRLRTALSGGDYFRWEVLGSAD